MKKQIPLGLLGLSIALFASGCASTPSTPSAGLSLDKVLAHEDVKGKTPTVYQHPIAKVKTAASRAVVFVGAKINKDGPYYVRGRRPNKVGLLVGSGGETIEVFLNPKSETETEVWVDTDLSFAGIAGQQSWTKQVLEEMDNLLNEK